MKQTGLRVAQVAAVVFAIAASAWIVVMAQQGAKRDGKAPDATPAPAAEGEAPDPGFLPSSKSLIGVGPGPGEALEGRDEEAEATEAGKAKKPAFLPSSKSIPLDAFPNGETPAPKEPTAPKTEPVKEVPFLPTSKSGFVPKAAREEIERKAKEAAEAARKAKEAADK